MVRISEVCIFPEARFAFRDARERPMQTAPSNAHSTCTVRLEESRGGATGSYLLGVPGTEYTLDLVAGGATSVAVGKRVSGVISGRAQKLHRAHAGGEFIEPVEGHPRIVQGRVRDTDPTGNRLLLQAVVPMWITLSADQSARSFAAGDIVNFYMESGVVFTPQA
jgi:hypothetical protein